jgi:RNA polymerase sigma-70 factor (ECF subfamily)
LSDTETFERIALPYLDAVYRAAVALCGRSGDADDLAQETFLRAFERFELFQTGTNCKAWLFQILRNIWIDRLRKMNVTGRALPLEEQIVAEPAHEDGVTWSNSQDLLENFSDEHVIDALRDLPDDQRLTLFLVDVEQLSQNEVAEIMGVATGTVKSRTSRGRTALKRRLASHAKQMGLMRGRTDGTFDRRTT